MANFKEFWGIRVPVTPSGRLNWPNTLKDLATKRVLDNGERIATVASEIDAHENLVRKWCIQARRARGEDVASQPTFAPVVLEEQKSLPPFDTSMKCKLHVGDAVLEFPSDISADQLKTMLRAMKEAL